MVASLQVIIMDEVNHFLQRLGFPVGGFTEDHWLLDLLILKVGIVSLYLTDQILLEERVNTHVIVPAELLGPEHQGIDVIGADPAVMVFIVVHTPLP